MNASGSFERVLASVQKIARHAYYPGFDEAISHSLQDVDDLLSAGRITSDERDALRLLLLGISLNDSSRANAA